LVHDGAYVYSSATGRLFIVGGDDATSGRPRGRVWLRRLDDSVWRVLDTDYRPVHVLAATFDKRTEQLIVLDERPVKRGNASQVQVRLVAIDVTTGAARRVHRWVRSPAWDAQSLQIDLDGSVLLSASSTRLDRYVLARLDPTSWAVLGRERGVGALVFPLVPDGVGYTEVHRAPDDATRLIAHRRSSRALGAGRMQDLDEAL